MSSARKRADERIRRRFGFAADYDAPIPYLQRVRDYYQGLGYGAPYRWAHYAEVPFRPLGKPLAECRVALITTAAPYRPEKGDQGPGAPYNAAAKFYQVYSGDTAIDHDLRISHVAYDRDHTTAEDSNTWFPLPQLRNMAAAGRIGEVTQALPRRADQPQSAHHPRSGLPGIAGALPCRPARMPRSWSLIARCVTKPCVWPPGIWRGMA